MNVCRKVRYLFSVPKQIIIIKHIELEGPGTLGEFLGNSPWDMRIIDLSRGSQLPENLKGLAGVVCLGGPMNVYEEESYSFLKEEDRFIKEVLKRRIPFLGICLGSQLLAKAAAARITRAPLKEIGYFDVALTDEAKKDRLFAGLADKINVFQWHGDTFGIPDNGALLAEGVSCKNQALRVGKNAYGLQFHVEVTPRMIHSWARRYQKEEGLSARVIKGMCAQAQEKRKDYEEQANLFYENFAGIIKEPD